ncbi:MAG: hypothetical protein H8E55_48415 [Pelagibacterales bacterium]|nr:hypothetical protein [Pelagibacterales bacterium]
MSNFFYRQSSVTVPSGGRIRKTAWVKIVGGDFSMPISATTHNETYNPNKTGRPAPVLKDVSIKLEGDAGSLRRAVVGFMCFDLPSFEAAEKALLRPGPEITISYGYSDGTGSTGSHKFKVYDYSFKITKEGWFDCSFKAVGKGNTYDEFELNAKGGFPENEFVTNYDWGNTKTKVSNLFDHIDYEIQRLTGTLGSSGFSPGHGVSGNGWGVLKAPKGYNPPTKMEGGVGTSYYLQYTSLGMLVEYINSYLLKGTDYLIAYSKYSAISTEINGEKIWSASPIEMLFPYSKGTPANSYHKEDTGKSEDYITIDSFNTVQAIGSDPSRILLGRDLLRTLQESFADDAKSEGAKEEPSEKSTGGIPLIKFFKRLFASIRENSGGAWDLYLDTSELDPGMIEIINKRAPVTGNVTPVELNPIGGSNGIRDLAISASVPKELQAKAFGGGPTTSTEEKAASVINDEEPPEDPEPIVSLSDQQKNARGALTDDKYQTSSISKAKSAVKSIVDSADKDETAKKGLFTKGNNIFDVPFPLTFSCTMDGVEGWRFGDTVSSSYLPSRYTKTAGTRTVFTVTKYEHKFSDNDWTTTIEALARIVGS